MLGGCECGCATDAVCLGGVLSITHASCRNEVAGTCTLWAGQWRIVRATVGGGYESDRLCRDHVARLDHARTEKNIAVVDRCL